jgi:hypothetical protein
MGSQTIDDAVDSAASDAAYYQQYRAVSTLAVASATLGLASLASFFEWALLVLPALGLTLGLVALRRLQTRRDELTGSGLAVAGIAMSALFGVAGASWLSYTYATEVPEWASRVDYEALQPDPDRPREIFPPSVAALDGQKIFIKGYVYPGSKNMDNIRQFILCRDKGDCCFGGNPKLTDRILVTLNGGLRLSYSQKLFRVAGTFHLRPAEAQGLAGGVIYHLDADYLK